MAARHKVGVERTLLCAVRLWSIDGMIGGRNVGTTPTHARAVRQVVRKQGYTSAQIATAERRLIRGGFVKMGGGHHKTIALTPKGGRVGCATVKLAPWTNEGYPGATLRGLKKRRR